MSRHYGNRRSGARRQKEEGSSAAWVVGLLGALGTWWLSGKLKDEGTARQRAEQQNAEAQRQADVARRQAEESQRQADAARVRAQEAQGRAQRAESEAERQTQRAESAETELKKLQQSSEKTPPAQKP